jgi:hypothetical protein
MSQPDAVSERTPERFSDVHVDITLLSDQRRVTRFIRGLDRAIWLLELLREDRRTDASLDDLFDTLVQPLQR